MLFGSLEVASKSSIKIGCWVAETVTQRVIFVKAGFSVALIACPVNQSASKQLMASVRAPTVLFQRTEQTAVQQIATRALHSLRAVNAQKASQKLVVDVSVSDQLEMEFVILALPTNSGTRKTVLNALN